MKQEEISFKTKKALADSLKKIMQKKPFSKITVRDITEACNVNRNTFYYHFEDIYGLLRWMFDQEAVQVVQQFNLMVDYREAIVFIMDYVEQNEHIIACALDAIGYRELKRFFFSDFYNIIETLITDAGKQKQVTLDSGYEQFLAYFYTEALAGMLMDWIQHRFTADRETLIQQLYDTIKYSLMGIFAEQTERITR